METIDIEAKINSRIPTNIDYMSEQLKCNSSYIIHFPALWVIEKNLFYLLRYSTEEKFQPKHRMKPSYLSFDKYGTTTLGYLLMYVNNVQCLEDFDLTTVIIPDFSAIVELCKDRYKNNKTIDELKTIDW